jgi:hypothetical protein
MIIRRDPETTIASLSENLRVCRDSECLKLRRSATGIVRARPVGQRTGESIIVRHGVTTSESLVAGFLDLPFSRAVAGPPQHR